MPLITLAVALVLVQDPTSDPSLDVKLSFRQDAVALPKLVTALGAASHAKLSAVAALDSQVVVADFKDARLGDAMSRIADVTDCEWRADANGFTLMPSATKRAAQFQAEVQKRLKLLKKVFAEFQELAEAKVDASAMANYIKEQQRRSSDRQDYTPADESVAGFSIKRQYGSALPSGRSFARTVVKIDPVMIASLRPDDRIVFSTSPNKMQKSVKVDLAQEAELRDNDAAAYKAGVKMAGLSKGSENRASKSLAAKIDKIEVVASRRQEWFGIEATRLEYRVLDAQGAVLDRHSVQIPFENSKLSMLETGSPDATVKPKFEAKPDSLWHWQALTSMMTNAVVDPADPRMSSIVLSPDRAEPLSFLTSDLLIGCSRQEGKNLIAEVNDFALILAATQGADGSDFPNFRKRVLSVCFNDLSKNENWTLLQPISAAEERDNRIDRTGLARYLRSPDQAALIPLSEYAAKRRLAVSINFVELAYMMAANGSRNLNGFASIENLGQPALAYIGTLDPQTRNALIGGATFIYGKSPDAQKKILDRLAFGATGVESLTYDENTRETSKYDGYDRVREPTDLMPNGVPYDATARLLHTDAPALYTLDTDGKTWKLIEYSEVAMAIAALKNPKLKRPDDPSTMPTKFKLGTKRSYEFRFYVTPVAFYSMEYEEQVPAVGQQVLSYQQLPPNLRKQIEDTAKDIAEGGIGEEDAPAIGDGGATGGGGGRVVTS